ncbi:SDR family NAD(P)-dependent oxidoreductase [Parapedobacter indicus]|uniref:3-oxoacyl-[acyl-carrier protein] reductase n=1 Tax=Parapedobacter indicus TaxID=1477437 RepID=A0A1I3GTE1_9SPHI|nr:SDR family oxidoreductase [Parapedobacter indicus]PPL02774.1 3-oxoacyl-[acyl-carrier protein] reductase [Parapedobacter indicus]SFI26666.1 3-oxoacyl-[acyl-carrier protein] reductase [Parapedobacter indicus]
MFDMTQFSNQVAVITGAASGIGNAIARQLLAAGVRLALIDKQQGRLDGDDQSNRVNWFLADITVEAAVENVIRQVTDQYGRIDILINSAGITGVTNIQSHQVESSDLHNVFNVNFFGSFLMAKHVLPQMLKRNYGRILHIASIAGKEGNAGMLAYSASKAAVIGMTKVQGKEYAETGITVNALAPAVVRTALVDRMPAEQVNYMTDKIPMKRCGTLEEVANLAMYIVSPENSFTTGFTFDLSGGRATY